ncbi:MAG: site-specific integrase [Acidobacteria bacterium]|nr:site-specific integrase [Acidobacteriota bacterium]
MIYKRSGVWWTRFQINGVRYHLSIREAVNRRKAQKAEDRLKGELLAGRFEILDQRSDLTFKVLASRFMQWSKDNRRSWRSDQSRIKPLEEFFSERGLREISPILIEKFKNERRQSMRRGKKPRCASTVNRELALLRRIFNLAIQNKWLRVNPVSAVKFLPESRGRERYLTVEEERRLLAVCNLPDLAYLKPVVILALNTGMRKGELLNLTWDRVNLEAGEILVTQTKSGQDRTIPISPLVAGELAKLRDTADSEFIFANPLTGDRYSDLKSVFPRACRKAGISGVVFHTLRHTAASRMVASGMDLRTVQEILGHTEIATTQRYLHAMPERKTAAVQALARYTEEAMILEPESTDFDKQVAQEWPKLKVVAQA